MENTGKVDSLEVILNQQLDVVNHARAEWIEDKVI